MADLTLEQKQALAIAAARARAAAAGQGHGTGAGEAALHGAAQGLTFGFVDEAASAIGGAWDAATSDKSFGEAYSERHDKAQRHLENLREDSPWIMGGSELAGAIPSSILAPQLHAARLGRVGNAALNAGAQGAVAGFGEGSGAGRIEGALVGGGAGFALGAGLAGLGQGVGKLRADRAAHAAAQEMPVDPSLVQLADAFGLPLTRGEKAQDIAAAKHENMARKGGYGDRGQQIAQRFDEARGGDLARIVDDLNQKTASGAPLASTADDASRMLAPQIEGAPLRLQRLQEEASRQADPMPVAKAVSGADPMVANEVEAARRAAGRLGSQATLEKTVIDAEYAKQFARQGEFAPEAIQNAGSHAEQAINMQGKLVDPQVFPVTAAAIKMLNSPDINKLRKVPATKADAGFKGEDVERIRQQLNTYFAAAQGQDKWAMRQVKEAFDQRLFNAIDEGLWSGDPDILEGLKGARQLYREHMQRFYPEGPARGIMKRLAEGTATPEKLSNVLFGSATLGAPAEAANIALHLRQVLGNGPEWQALQQGGWAMLTKPFVDGINPKVAQKVAGNIENFLTHKGSTLASVLYDEAQRQAWKNYASQLRSYATSKHATQDGLEALASIGQKDFNPDKLAQAIATGGPTGWKIIQAAKAMYSPDSPTMGLVRQAAWREVTTKAPGATPYTIGTLKNRVADFVNSSAARELFDGRPEFEEMKKFVTLLEAVSSRNNAINASGSGDRVIDHLKKMSGSIAATIGFSGASIPGAIAGFGAGKVMEHIGDRHGAKLAERVFSGQSLPTRPSDAIFDGALAGLEPTARGAARVAGPIADVMDDPPPLPVR